jgi:hypothetical protein
MRRRAGWDSRHAGWMDQSCRDRACLSTRTDLKWIVTTGWPDMSHESERRGLSREADGIVGGRYTFLVDRSSHRVTV